VNVFNKTVFILFLGMMISFESMATSFQLMPLEQLVEESSSGAEVELKDKKTFVNKVGMIMTDFSFKVIDGYNISDDDLNGELLTITMSGGTLNGITSYIDGAPEFAIGEKSFLLLKKIESKLYLSNFTMGKYKIEKSENQIYYVSSVFPYDADLGRVKKERMVDLMKMKFRITRAPEPDSFRPAGLKILDKKMVPAGSVYEERKPAQVDSDDVEKNQDVCVAMWAFFALFSVSGVTIWWKLKKGVSV
jgi:hypothetical protein